MNEFLSAFMGGGGGTTDATTTSQGTAVGNSNMGVMFGRNQPAETMWAGIERVALIVGVALVAVIALKGRK